MVERQVVLRSEFIGRSVKVKGKHIQGNIVDETKNTFLIKNGCRKILVQKKGNLFEIKIGHDDYIIKGNSILMRPEDRIKIKNEN